MGDFILYHKDRVPAAKVEAALSCLALQGSVKPLTAEHDLYALQFFPKQLSPVTNFITHPQGGFCGSSGTFIYKGQMGEQALKALWDDFSIDHYQAQDFSGIFTVILKKDNRLFLLTDPMGGNRVYQNEGMNFWSSSFLAAASCCDKLTANPQAVYEYAFQETTYGEDTVFKEVNCLDSLKIFEFTPDGLMSREKNLAFDFQPSSKPQPELVAETVQLLRDTVKPVSEIFGDKIRTALSGGYDSRLMLALLRDSGTSPHVYVYGSDNSPDVQVARRIAKGQGFPLDHIDKSKYPKPTVEQYSETVRDNFYGLDGLPGESIFDFGANMATRRTRAAKGYMIFNGGGGEIFRNFFYLPDSKFNITDLINSFYSRYTTAICQNVFNEQAYGEALHHKIKTALGVSSDTLNRTELEYAYPAFRLRYWTSRDNNNNTRLGPYLTPFVSYRMIKQALTIPLTLKNHGIFQADLIKTISPALASYPSDYGYSLDGTVPLKAKFKNYLTYYRPTDLRRYSYALQHRMRQLTLPESLKPEFLDPILPDGMPYMSEYFKIPEIRDSSLLARVATLEYLFKHFGV